MEVAQAEELHHWLEKFKANRSASTMSDMFAFPVDYFFASVGVHSWLERLLPFFRTELVVR